MQQQIVYNFTPEYPIESFRVDRDNFLKGNGLSGTCMGTKGVWSQLAEKRSIVPKAARRFPIVLTPKGWAFLSAWYVVLSRATTRSNLTAGTTATNSFVWLSMRPS